MRYRLDLYEITNTTREAFGLPLLNGTWKRGLPNEDSIEFTLPMYDARGERLYDTNDDADGSQRYILTPQKWLRLVDLDLSTPKSYVIRDIEKTRNADGQAVIKVKAEGYAFKYLDKIVPIVSDFAGITATIFLDQILAGSGLTAGTNQIPTTEKRTVHIEYPNIVEALNVITDTWDETAGGVKKRFFWRINENDTVDILREDTYGSTVVPKFTPKRNLLSLAKGVSSRKLVNRMFASTHDGGSLIESQRTWYRDTIDGPDITVVGNTDSLTLNGYGDTSNKLAARSYVALSIKTEVVWATAGNADFKVSAELQTSAGVVRARFDRTVNHTGSGTTTVEIKDTILEVQNNTDAEKLVVKFEAFTINSGTVTSKRVWMSQIWYWTAPNVNYVDGANQATYGVVEGRFTDEALNLMAHNLISDYKKITGTRASPTITAIIVNADFTGTYTSGVCAGWSATASLGTLSENTNKDFILHGTSSQKITATMVPPAIHGIQSAESFPLRQRYVYYFEIVLYVDIGQVRVQLVNQTTSALDIDYKTTGRGRLIISGFLSEAGVTGNGKISGDDSYKWVFYNTAESGSAPTCYIDAVMICIAGDARPFTRKSVADDLRTKALDAMGLNESPAKTFSLDMADLGELEPNINSAERFQPGDYIKIDDKTLNVAATLRVQQKTIDLINPEKSQIAVELLPTRPGDILFRALGRPELALQRS